MTSEGERGRDRPSIGRSAKDADRSIIQANEKKNELNRFDRSIIERVLRSSTATGPFDWNDPMQIPWCRLACVSSVIAPHFIAVNSN